MVNSQSIWLFASGIFILWMVIRWIFYLICWEANLASRLPFRLFWMKIKKMWKQRVSSGFINQWRTARWRRI